MKLAVEYGVLDADVEEQIAYYQSLDISHIILGAWALPGYQEEGILTEDIAAPVLEPMADAGISVDAFWFGDNSIAAMMDPAKAPDIFERFFASMAIMSKLGISTAPVMNTVPVEDEARRDDMWDSMIEVYQRLVEKAEPLDITIVSHTHWVPQFLVHDTDTSLQYLDEVGSDNNKLLFCAGSLWSAGDDMFDSVKRLGDRIGMVHFRDSLEKHTEAVNEIPLGTGNVDFHNVVRALDEIGYDGMIRPEHMGGIAGERDRTAIVAHGVGFARGIMHALDIDET